MSLKWQAKRSRLFLLFVASCSILGLAVGPLAIASEGISWLSVGLSLYGLAHFFLFQTAIAAMYDPPERVRYDNHRLIQIRWYLSIPVPLVFPKSRLFHRLHNELARASSKSG
jgi:hypothetical protein